MVARSIGQRIAIARRRRGLSQAVLANLIGRSESWLSQVERGIRSVDRLPVLMDLAEVLRVDAESLLGRPWKYAPNGGHLPDELEPTRRYLNGYRHLHDTTWSRVDPEALAQRVRDGHVAYQAAHYGAVASALPTLLSDADMLRRSSRTLSEPGTRTYISAYILAAKLLRKLGALELAMVTADRAATASVDGAFTVERGLAAYQVVGGLMRADQVDDAETLAVSVAAALSSEAKWGEPELLSVVGSLWLLSAVIAARRTDKYEALDRLSRAHDLASLLGSDGNYGWTAFGPTNVAIHHVSVAAELGEAGEALRAAQSVNPADLPEGLVGRRAQLHLDLAWAYAQGRRGAEAALHLIEAENIAPEAVRYNVLVREHIREMLARGKSGQTRVLHDLAVRSGVVE